MRSPKVIISIIAVVLLVAGFFVVRRATDHTGEFRRALYSGNLSQVEALLKAHPSLIKANNMDSPAYIGRDQPERKWTALHVAAFRGDAPLIRLLVHYNASLEARDKRGLTPLLWTAFIGKPEGAAELLSDGADINARGLDGRTTLALARIANDPQLVALLRERGAKE